jgi:hypothetical protein
MTEPVNVEIFCVLQLLAPEEVAKLEQELDKKRNSKE